MTRHIFLGLFTLGVTGCALTAKNSPSLPAEPEVSSEPVGVSVTRDEGTHRIWRTTPTEELQSYRSTIKTTIEEQNTQENRKFHFTTSADYSLRLLRSTSKIDLSGTVLNFQVNADKPDSLSPSSFEFPMIFSGKIADHNIFLRPSNSNKPTSLLPCNDSLQILLSVINRDLVIVPTEISTDQGWQDSTSSMICSGSVPVDVSMLRNYRITGETIVDGMSALQLERTEKLLASGQGSQGQHQISISGVGTGRGQIYVDRVTGTLLSLTATNEIELSIKSSGRTQMFTQRSEEILVRKSPR